MWNIIRRELLILCCRRRLVFVVLLAAASAYAMLIGTLYRGQIVQAIPVAVCDLDQSALSRQLIRDAASADSYHFVGTTASEAEAEEWLRSQKAAAVIVIPPDFAGKFSQGQDVTLGFLQDGANTLEASYASQPMQLIWADWLGRFRAGAITLHGTPQVQPGAVGLSLRYMGNPTQSYLAFYVYGVMLTAAQLGLAMSYALSVQEDSRSGYYRRHGMLRVMAGKMGLYWVCSFCAVLAGIGVLVGLFHLPLYGNLGAVLLLCGAFLFAVENLAGLAGLYFRTKVALTQCFVFYSLPAFLISGYIWPEQAMPGIVRFLAWLQPLHYAMSDFRQLALTGQSAAWGQHASVLIGAGVLALLTFTVLLPRVMGEDLCRERTK